MMKMETSSLKPRKIMRSLIMRKLKSKACHFTGPYNANSKIRVIVMKGMWMKSMKTIAHKLSRYVQDCILMRFKFLMISITKCPHW